MERYTKLIEEKEKLLKKINSEQTRLQRSKSSAVERRKRTHRLVQKGALLEKFFDIEHLSIKDTENFLKIFSDFVKSNTPEKYKKDN